MKKGKQKLVLFDIDGTLISAGGAGTRSMDLAFYRLFGIKDAFRSISMAGKTDPQIMKEGLKLHGLPHRDGYVEKMKELYLYFLENEIENPLRRLKPGIGALLDAMRGAGTPLGLLTGNLRKGAEIKLTAFGIYENFIDGAFGSDDEDRDKLLPIALKKFTQKGFFLSPEDCIVVGDTPRDVSCAKIHKAHCMAVATGPYSREELLTTDADIVLDSLDDTAKCMEFILSC